MSGRIALALVAVLGLGIATGVLAAKRVQHPAPAAVQAVAAARGDAVDLAAALEELRARVAFLEAAAAQAPPAAEPSPAPEPHPGRSPLSHADLVSRLSAELDQGWEDPGASEALRGVMLDAVRELELDGRLVGARCGERLCRAELAFGDRTDPMRLAEALPELFPGNREFAFDYRDGDPLRPVLFLAPEGGTLIPN